ncbi:MAG: hypothetical protein DRP09_20400 [Candidatus Thorarchaeota archaeon]|nr:MAG: hypothetical protein DRP09_20400 [Candidatus Thorarchaeota archaeon]
MKYFRDYNLYIPKKKYREWKKNNPTKPIFELIQSYLAVTDHGTICKAQNKAVCEELNKEGKGLDYAQGLSLGTNVGLNKLIKKEKKKKDYLFLKKLVEDGKASKIEINRYKRLRLLK